MTKPKVVRSTKNAPGVLQTDTEAWLHGPTMKPAEGELPAHPEAPEKLLPEREAPDCKPKRLKADSRN